MFQIKLKILTEAGTRTHNQSLSGLVYQTHLWCSSNCRNTKGLPTQTHIHDAFTVQGSKAPSKVKLCSKTDLLIF